MITWMNQNKDDTKPFEEDINLNVFGVTRSLRKYTSLVSSNAKNGQFQPVRSSLKNRIKPNYISNSM